MPSPSEDWINLLYLIDLPYKVNNHDYNSVIYIIIFKYLYCNIFFLAIITKLLTVVLLCSGM